MADAMAQRKSGARSSLTIRDTKCAEVRLSSRMMSRRSFYEYPNGASYGTQFHQYPLAWLTCAGGLRTMMQQVETAERRIRTLIEAWADAVRRHDMPGILDHHAQDIVMFDLPPPLQSKGMEDYKKTWDLFFKYHKPSQAFDIEELEITAGDDVAFASAVMRCGAGPKPGGFPFRLTIGLRKVDGNWRVTHEHHSIPAEDG